VELISTKEIWAALERARVALNEGAQLMQRKAKDREALIVAADLIEVSEGIKRVNGVLGHSVSPGIRFSVTLDEEVQEPAKTKGKSRKSKEQRVETTTGSTS
jgi:hypothetical protein